MYERHGFAASEEFELRKRAPRQDVTSGAPEASVDRSGGSH
jgi:hypothetical protein